MSEVFLPSQSPGTTSSTPALSRSPFRGSLGAVQERGQAALLGLQPGLWVPREGQTPSLRGGPPGQGMDGWVGGVLSPALPKKQKIAKAYGFPPGMEARLEGRPVARIGG